MGRFLRRLVLFCTLQLAIAVVFLVAGRGAIVSDDLYLGAVLDKHKLLTDVGQPRIIFVGGSNLAFGLDSTLFRDRLNRQPVNMGLHAGLGLCFPLRLVQEHVGRGDIVVVSPEYALISSETLNGIPAVIEALVDTWPESNRLMGNDDIGIKRFFDQYGLIQLHKTVRRGRRGFRGHKDVDLGVYRRSGFNQYGDMIAHHGQPSTALMGGSPLDDVSPKYVARAIECLNEFSDTCRAKGAEAYFSFAPLPRDHYHRSREGISRLHTQLSSSLRMPIINGPDELSLPHEDFFDTIYHLTKAGGARRSRIVLGGLLHQLGIDADSVASIPISIRR